MEILMALLSVIFVYIGLKALWTSTLILDARKKAFRDGTHDYYGNKIEKDEESLK
jgi:hypothetical protein|tara:strand:+ start:1676 stop:1840 length:165 start_codon:yes stop_codon:yes gene_type:complete